MNKGRVTLHICSKDRHTELALLLESLRHQTYQDFDLLILDDASGSPITNAYFIQYLLNRMKLENHRIKLVRNNQSFGCCFARNKCISEDEFDNEFTFRCDDDVVLESNYIRNLLDVIEAGYDMASGVVPQISIPELKRELRFVEPIINKKELDKDGNLIFYKDDCGFCYNKEEILPAMEFRTNCLYKSEINKKIKYPENLSSVAFREEAFFSTKAIIERYKIGVNTSAVAWHLQCPSGGNRRPDYNECVALDHNTFVEWIKQKFKQHGDFFKKYEEEVLK